MTETELRTRVAELEAQALAVAQKSVPSWVKIAGAVLLLALLVTAAVAGYHWLKHDHAVVMSQQQIKQAAELAQKLSISDAQAKKIATELAAAQNRKPDIRYIVEAPTVEKAAERVKRDIDAGKSPANKIPADKTVVTPNKAEQKVDVYRINLDKARWGVSALVLAGGNESVEFGAGAAYHNKDWSVSAGGTNRGRVFVMGSKYF